MILNMDVVMRKKYALPKLLTLALCLIALYCLLVFKESTKALPTGKPVDWRNVPPVPPFPHHKPIPMPDSFASEIFAQENRPADHNDAHRSRNLTVTTDYSPIDRLYRDLGIVTAFSENHYREALGLIGTVQSVMPDKKIVVYDLGIESETLVKVKQLCNIELRKFPFEKYPPHVRDLHTYAWKVIIINITLHEFGAIFWADTSIRFKKSLRNLVPYARRHHGYMTHFHAFDPRGRQDTRLGHIVYFTYPKMFAALGINRIEYTASINATPHASANRQLFVNSPYLQNRLIRPLLQCALQSHCISPPGARFGKHRFDASALSLLLFKNMRFEWTETNNDNAIFDDVIDIHRTEKGWQLAQSCST